MGHYYKDDKILQEFLTNEEGFNYLNQSKQKIWSLQYLIQQYKTIKHYSSSYVEKLMNKGMVLQQNENEEQQNQIKKSERFQEQISSLNSYKVCFSELKKTLILQINNNSTQINVIEKDIEKLNEFQSESLINEFTKKCQYELKQNIIQQSQLQKTMRQIQTIHKYIESIDNCVLMFDNRVNEYEILKKTALVIQMQEKDYRDKNEWQEINKSLEMTLLESQKYHEIAEKESKKIIDRLDKELPVILKMIQECFYYTQL